MRRVEAEEPEGAKYLQSVREVLDGARLALSGGGSKVLRFMLEHPEGCDGSITPSAFEIRFGWHPSRHRYILSVAPAVVSQLLVYAEVHEPTRRVRAGIGPAHVPAVSFLPWSFGRRLLWLDADEQRVTVHVREAGPETSVTDLPPDAAPDSVVPAPVYLELQQPFPCPHCRRELTTYRVLSDEVWVCVSCGRSFELGASSRPPPGARRSRG